MAGPRVISHSVRVLGANPENVMRWAGSAARFGVAAGAGVLFIAECLPPAKTDLFCKLPVIGSYWKAYEAKDEE
ncbi:hypothetical protein BGZ93_006218 [Podila epicladia]|uniref:Uncharacterized protein n=1 Tax=Podila minutissima TaxID=64525 RepID=A0A9P5SM57_9FUNG|nr:hypothetical protein BGZ74_008989 [Mortierella antarctica]KAF9333378.1 hypothetical protein BG006_003716 [Podila minutissima]KAG0032102.1 hypothetical protein BGZ81_011678 [Podila clonocystis]KAG0049713.1 hypothetical protein BGZ83_005484 [Gryganskiella cystojenkinii]KAG0084368.1 hypothetical protein BGZ92_009940 [Podila epicladia]KAG0320568.1 hypothetical protein BG000_003528 [Podila horticola]